MEYIKGLIETDSDLKNKLKNRISEALDKCDLKESMQGLIDSCIENADIDLTSVLKSMLMKKIKQ